MLIGKMLRLNANRFPQKPALISGGIELDYATLDAQANRCANALMALGLGPQAKLCLMARNVAAYPIIHFGAARTNLVLAHASFRYTADELAYVLDKMDVEVLLVERPFAPVAAQALEKIGGLEHVVLINGEDDFGADDAEGSGPQEALAGATRFADFLAPASSDHPGIALRSTDPSAICFTGGTTGFPKGAVSHHRCRWHAGLATVLDHRISEHDVNAVITPMFHAAALAVWYHGTVLAGATAVLLPQWSTEAFQDIIRRHHVIATFFVPTMLTMLLDDPAFDAELFGRLGKIGYGGSPMPLALLEELRQRFPQLAITANYGQTEGCPLTMMPPEYLPEKLGSIGRPPSTMEVAVVDPEGRPIAPGEVGEIVSRGDHMMTEYYKDPERTAEYFRRGDDWGWTGDLATVDEDGFVTLMDRRSDMFISGGENIHPKEIENILYQHPEVVECAVFGIPDRRWGEVAAAHVQLKEGARLPEQELIDFCAQHLANFKRPRLIRFVDELPKTAVGKIQKNVLRAEYQEADGEAG